MPLFGRKGKQKKEQQYMGTIITIPKYEDMMKFLSDWIMSEFKLDEKVVLLLDILFDGVAMDEARVCMLAPTSGNFVPPPEFEEVPLNSLDMGVDEDGLTIVGFRKTIVKKKYVDGFVHAMKDVYNTSWEDIHTLVHRKEAYPIILTANSWTFIVAPIVSDLTKKSWAKGTYDPVAKVWHCGYSCNNCVYSDGYLVEGVESALRGLVSVPVLKEHWVCTKFSLNLDGRLGFAEKCTSYLTQREYEQKCLSGEMEQLKPVTTAECVYCGASYDITKHFSCPVCGATLKKKLK